MNGSPELELAPEFDEPSPRDSAIVTIDNDDVELEPIIGRICLEDVEDQ